MILKVKHILLFLSLLTMPVPGFSDFFSLKDYRKVISLKLVNSTNSNQSIALLSNTGNFAPTPSNAVNSLSGTITIGYQSQWAAYDSLRNRIWVTNFSGIGQVTVIDCASNAIVSVINVASVGGFTNYAAYNSINDTMYVTSFGDATTSVIVYNAGTFAQVSSIAIVVGLNQLAFDSGNNRMYINNSNNVTNNVYVIDCTNNTLLTTITVGLNGFGIAYDPVNLQIYCVNNTSNTVSVISTVSNTVIATISIPATNPREIAYDPVNGNMYLACTTGGVVKVIQCSTNTVINTITGIPSAYSICYDSNAQVMYVERLSTGTSTAIISTTTQTVVGSITGSAGARFLIFSPTSYKLFKGNTAASIDISVTGSAVIPTGPIPYNQIINDILGNPINVQNISIYSYNGSINQASQTITLNRISVNGNTLTDVILPAISPDQVQGGVQANIPTPDFVGNGLNYIGLTLLAGQTVGLKISYDQVTPEEIKNNAIIASAPALEPDATEYVYNGIEKEEVKKPFFLTVEELIGCKF